MNEPKLILQHINIDGTIVLTIPKESEPEDVKLAYQLIKENNKDGNK